MMMNLGPHATFIVAAYVVATLIVAALLIWIVRDYAAQRRLLRELENRGVTRRSERSP
jgi:heme exporter protein D